MKTIAFHSAKGGVGRTLALCNFAIALQNMGKRVLLIDIDYSSPGLQHKLKLPPSEGYIEYLREFSVEERASFEKDSNWQARVNKLKTSIIHHPDYQRLWVLLAGNAESSEY